MTRLQAGVFVALLAVALQAQQPAASPKSPGHTRSSGPEAGAISEGVYHNPSFEFSYNLPYGWVDRTRVMQDDSAESSKSLLLLAVFERPPEATGDTLNSAVVIVAEPLSAYPGLKTAADYFGPLSELATSKGFQAVDEPHDFSVGPVRLVRGDFSKPRGTLTARQTSLVVLQKSYEVSFTFIGASEDEINELIEKLSFVSRRSAH